MNGLHFSAVNWPLAASALISRKSRARIPRPPAIAMTRWRVRALGPGASNRTSHFGTHRFTASRREKVVKRIPRGSVKITNPAAMIPKMT